MDNQVLIWLIGVIAFCMVFMMVIFVLIGIYAVKIMKHTNSLLVSSQNNLTRLSTQAEQTINDIKTETKILAYQVSGDISKLTVATFLVGSLYKFLNKKLNSESTK
ncbi:MAG: hypothetical protein PHI79_01920 [Sulfurovaceae bacterium]|nr:hypothetical protein [Sulfurovaceae bacterium]MDD5548332.1 hypothetical protein [Sulfurovaceae bacterium]